MKLIFKKNACHNAYFNELSKLSVVAPIPNVNNNTSSNEFYPFNTVPPQEEVIKWKLAIIVIIKII